MKLIKRHQVSQQAIILHIVFTNKLFQFLQSMNQINIRSYTRISIKSYFHILVGHAVA